MSNLPKHTKVASRIVLAVFGSYAIAVWVSILPLALSTPSVSAMAWGKIFGVVIGSFVFVWVFCVQSLSKIWLMMMMLNIFLFGLCYCFVPDFMAIFPDI